MKKETGDEKEVTKCVFLVYLFLLTRLKEVLLRCVDLFIYFVLSSIQSFLFFITLVSFYIGFANNKWHVLFCFCFSPFHIIQLIYFFCTIFCGCFESLLSAVL